MNLPENIQDLMRKKRGDFFDRHGGFPDSEEEKAAIRAEITDETSYEFPDDTPKPAPKPNPKSDTPDTAEQPITLQAGGDAIDDLIARRDQSVLLKGTWQSGMTRDILKILRESNATPCDVFAMEYLCTHCHLYTGKAWSVNREEIAERIDFDLRSVRRSIQRLKDWKLIVNLKDDGGKRTYISWHMPLVEVGEKARQRSNAERVKLRGEKAGTKRKKGKKKP